MKRGTIMVCSPNHAGVECLALDIKISNTFPMVTLERPTQLVDADGKEYNVSGFDHFSIPADLELHFSGSNRNGMPKEYLFFESPLVDPRGFLLKPHAHLFTLVSEPAANNSPPQGQWHQAQMVHLVPDLLYTPTVTRVFLDFFVHARPTYDWLPTYPLSSSGMRRIALDAIGPFWYADIVRKPSRPARFFFSYRVGFCEADPSLPRHMHVPRRLRPPRGIQVTSV